MLRRRIIRALRINEISGVDRPAQEGALALIMKANRKELARIRELEQRKARLEEEIGALYRAEEDKERVRQLEAEVGELETELEQRKLEARLAKLSESPAVIRKSAEDLMDRYAQSIRKADETFEAAYARACMTDMGRSILANIDDAYRLQVGQPTNADFAV